MTRTVTELRADLKAIRAEHGRGSSQGREAFDRLCVAAAAEGQPLDALRRHSRIESERFFARTVAGPDGHVYWDGESKVRRHRFTRNDGKERMPARWWWEHVNGSLPSHTYRVTPTCGDRACINPEHSEARPFQRPRYTERQLLGLIQTTSLRLGHSPSRREWDRLVKNPTSSAVAERFGTWVRALASAGLAPKGNPAASREECLASLRRAREILGRWPTWRDYRGNDGHRELLATLKAEGLPYSCNALNNRLGTFAEAVRAAEAES